MQSVLNSEIHDNGTEPYGTYYGIDFVWPYRAPVIRNCTIVYNDSVGVYLNANYIPSLNLKNSIVWGNNDSGEQFVANSTLTVSYSCVDGFSSISEPNIVDGGHNIEADPNFAYSGIYDYNLHLAYDSPCKNKGDTSLADPNSTGESDIDYQYRISDTYVDIGADEITCDANDIASPLDANGDGLVNYFELVSFGNNWERDTSDPNWSSADAWCDLDSDDDVDLSDLILWADDWLWEACWLTGYGSVYDYYIVQSAQQQSSMPVVFEPVEIVINADEVMRFMELIAGDMLTEKAIKRKDLIGFISALEDFLYDN